MSEILYLRFEEVEPVTPRKTKVIAVYSIRWGYCLGMILWRSGWRQYVFEPGDGTVWSIGCMTEISEVIERLMRERREEREPTITIPEIAAVL